MYERYCCRSGIIVKNSFQQFNSYHDTYKIDENKQVFMDKTEIELLNS